MKTFLICSIIYVTSVSLGFWIGWDDSRKNAFEDIISEKCWLNKQTRDIECITHIAE